ncbi:MAG TPA: DUF3667 domain-containing protein [Sphingomicrobium sp.]|nr:DUF3667 domain-containing protein [Sphingomicrobium sp.]
MPESGAVGDAITGGLAARAVEPVAAEAEGHTHEKNCLNCGASLAGAYCHDCGQKAHVHRTLRAFWHDILHSVFHFEGRVWRTLPMLAWHPGVLTRRYIDGERATFVSPIALFLFSAFLMFAVAGLTGAFDSAGSPQRTTAQEIDRASAKIKRLEASRAEAMAEKKSTARIDEQLVETRAERAILQRIRVGTAPKAQVSSKGAPQFLQGWIDKAAANPDLLFYKLKTNAYKFSWALIPLSVPFVWLLFPWNRRFTFYDHTVFVTYSLCFMMLLLIVASTVGLLIPLAASFAWLAPPFHMYRHLKETYDLKRRGALWRTALLIGFAFVAVGLFMAIIAGAGAVD